MFYDQFQRLVNSVPRLPSTLRQSFENPVQADRLPNSQAVETEFPILASSARDSRKIVNHTLLAAGFTCIFRSLPEYFMPLPWAHDVWGLFASGAAAAIVASYVGWPTKIWHWLVYVFALPALMLYIMYLRSIFFLLLLATLFTVFIADSFTKQTLYLGSTTPFPRQRARVIRKKWPLRFLGIRPVRGMELYILVIAILIATPWLIDGIATEVNPFGGGFRLQATLACLGIIVLSPVIVEVVASVIYNRPALRISFAWKAFKRSFLEWHCYNNKAVHAVAVLKSPVGSAPARRRMFVAAVLLWTSAINPLISYRYNLSEQLSVSHAKIYHDQQERKRESEEAKQAAIERFVKGPSQVVTQEETNRKAVAQASERDKQQLVSWNGDMASPPKLFQQLQPYQQKLVPELPVEQRIDFIRRALNIIPSIDEDIAARAANQESKPPKSEPEEVKPEGFLLLSQMVHPFKEDLVFGKQEEGGRIGFVIISTAVFIVGRELFVIALSFAFPVVFLYAASVRVAASLRDQLDNHPDTILSFGNWNQLVDEVITSDDTTEKVSLLLGTNKFDGSPVIVPRGVFEEHAHILGDSGSGKTSLGVSLILNQMIRQPDCSILVLDLKGDDTSLFRGTQLDAESCSKDFRWFTNELGKSSFAFNPLGQDYFQKLSLYQKTDVITSAIGLQYGTDYGRGFYSDANAQLLYGTLLNNPNVDSFQKLSRLLQNPAPGQFSREVLKAATHLVSVVQRLAATEAMNVTANSGHAESVVANQIDFASLFSKPQVAYFHLPSSLGATSAAEIARIALYSLLGSARETPNTERKQVFVFIDEFQRIIANNLDLILQTARSLRIGLILANQSMSDLKKPGVDLTPSVRTNTRYKQVFAASNLEDMRDLVELSGEALVHTRSFGEEGGALGGLLGGILKMTSSEASSPRLRANDILLAGDAPDQSIVQITRGSGYAQYGGFPFIMRSQFHISADEYAERKKSPWPEPNDSTLLANELQPAANTPVIVVKNPLAESKRSTASQQASKGLFDDAEELLKKRERRRNANKQQENPTTPDTQDPNNP